VGHCLHEGVVLWFCHQINCGEATAYDVEQKFVEFGGDLEQRRIVSLRQWLQFLRGRVHDHLALLLIKEKPHAHNSFQVFFAHFLKVRLRAL